MSETMWGDGLCLCVPELDREHSGLLALVREFDTAVESETSRIELQVLLSRLIAAFECHFRSEEETMHASGYEGYSSHAAEHRFLLQQITSLRDDLATGVVCLCGALALFVRRWTDRHIVGADAAFARFLSDGAGAAAAD